MMIVVSWGGWFADEVEKARGFRCAAERVLRTWTQKALRLRVAGTQRKHRSYRKEIRGIGRVVTGGGRGCEWCCPLFGLVDGCP